MATIKYLLQSKSGNVPVYLRLSLGRDKDNRDKDNKGKPISYKRKTGIIINANDWGKTGMPKQGKEDLKNIATDLRDLESFIYKCLNDVKSDTNIINGTWLQFQIDTFFDRIEVDDEITGIVEYGRQFINNLPYKVSDKGTVGVTSSTTKKYTTIVNKLEAFEQYRKKKILLKEIDNGFRQQLIEYFSTIEKLSDNTIGRYIKFIKTIVIDANKNGYEVNPAIHHFKGFTVRSPKVILSFDDIEKIKKTQFTNENHEIAKDWLIIGCFTGQRVSDLLRIKKSFIQTIQGFDFIVLEQIKTGKRIQIPIHYEVKSILDKRNGEFPPVFAKNVESNKTLFNRYLKQLCEKAGLTEMVEGNLFDEESERTVTGTYEKHKLVSSHICRRSFASNFYANPLYPTPLLMNITGHSTERMFLEYIGKKPIDYSVQLAKIWVNEALKLKKEPQLQVVQKKVSD